MIINQLKFSFIIYLKMDLQITNAEASQKIKSISLPKKIKGLRVPTKLTNQYHKKLKALQKMYEPINLDKIRTDGDKKIILVSEDFEIGMLGLREDQAKEVQIVQCDVVLGFNNLSNQEIFDMFLQGGEKVPFPNSFETAGHIAHYNLTPDQQKYKQIIGEITLLKCGNIKTVCNKTEKLHNVYRTPILQHMAGQKNYQVKMREVGVNFQFDFQRVYWCSRLQKERDRVLSYIKPEQCLADIFCGVGPLAVRAAKKGAYVIANDLNPSCYEYLVRNCKINAVENRVKCWNMCAREAVKKIYKEHSTYQPAFQAPDHFYMNLPVDAIQFLSELNNYGPSMQTQKMPLVHVNCFVVADSDEKSTELLTIRINKVLPGFKKEDIVSLHHIKNVTVIMRMYCLSFRLRPVYEGPVQGGERKVEEKAEEKKEEKKEENGKQGQKQDRDDNDGQIYDKVQKKIKEK